MTLELRPLGVACNLSCTYCYQDPQRDSGNVRQPYDLERMKAALTQAGGPFLLFGGEPLLVPIADLEELWRWGHERHQKNGIQTNGALIDDQHMELFKKYDVDVGISIDGPGELNDLRWNGSLEKTRAATARTEAAIERLCREWRPPGLIVTLHRGNATAEKLPVLHQWLLRLDGLGIKSVRLHLLEVDAPGVRQHHALSPRENVEALRSMAALQGQLEQVRFDMLAEMKRLLMGDDKRTSCVWHACDPYTTESVRGIEGNGQSSNCGRTNKDGIDFTKAKESGYERYLALYETPREHGGCKGCRFFLMCKGQCPGTAIDGDWRNRTEHCEVWMSIFTDLERQLVRGGQTPLTLVPVRRWLEVRMQAEWAAGRNPSIASLPRREPATTQQRPRFCRVSWVSDAARDLWSPRIERIAALQGEWALLQAARGEVAVPDCCRVSRELLPTVTVVAEPHCNVLLRRLGVYAVQHRPCSFDCAASAAIGRANVALLREAGYGVEAGWLEEILSFAVSWTALHGIAEIRTPVFRFITETEYTLDRRVLHVPGVTEVVAAGKGLGFPYQVPRRAAQLRVVS
jgi:uncharacterized protein